MASLSQDVGQGTVTVTATHQTKVSELKHSTWTCSDECLCSVEPRSLTLTLSP
jgi:hypothetical protein